MKLPTCEKCGQEILNYYCHRCVKRDYCIGCGMKIDKTTGGVSMEKGELCRYCVEDIIDAQEPPDKL